MWNMVKNIIRNIGAILLIALYWVGGFLATSGSFAATDNQYPPDANSERQTCFSTFTSDFYYSAARTERLTKDTNHAPVIDLKNWSTTPFGIIQADRILFKSKFSQYTRQRISFFIRCRKADIIFPFHYFW